MLQMPMVNLQTSIAHNVQSIKVGSEHDRNEQEVGRSVRSSNTRVFCVGSTIETPGLLSRGNPSRHLEQMLARKIGPAAKGDDGLCLNEFRDSHTGKYGRACIRHPAL